LPGYEFFAFYSPAQSVGGDYYDFITLPQGRVAVVLGDVAGKGVAAALLMAKLSAEVRFCMLTEPDPAKAVTLLNDQLIRGGIGDRFVTLAALVVDPAAHQVTVVNAGHINPMKLRPGGEFAEVISNEESGLPVGLTPGFPYAAKVVPLEPGDTLLVLTDGVTDSESPALVRFQQSGIAKAVQADTAACRPQAVGDRLVKAVQRHAAGHPQSDDIALVCFGRVDGATTLRPPDPRATPRQD
jgi:serine phosphatase RsbU (regulator of sigma subunit)